VNALSVCLDVLQSSIVNERRLSIRLLTPTTQCNRRERWSGGGHRGRVWISILLKNPSRFFSFLWSLADEKECVAGVHLPLHDFSWLEIDGGGVRIDVVTLRGIGQITATGGNAAGSNSSDNQGAGGGGRVALGV
jgi:hypothetical protein